MPLTLNNFWSALKNLNVANLFIFQFMILKSIAGVQIASDRYVRDANMHYASGLHEDFTTFLCFANSQVETVNG